YIMAALFACVILSPLLRLTVLRSSTARRISAVVLLVLCISPAFAAFYYHTMVYEEWSHGDHRRIAEIIYENIGDYYIYIGYDPHEIIEPVWIYCERTMTPEQVDLPIAFFKGGELTQNILPNLRKGPNGAMFLVPATAEGDALIGLLRNRYPGGRYEEYRLDREYFDHSKGSPLCQSYKIPREPAMERVVAETPRPRPTIGLRPTATSGPRVTILEGKRGAGPGEYKEPRGIALDSKGNVYVADFRNYRIQKFDRKGYFVTSWGEDGDYPGQFKDPCGVAADGKGRVYVADTFNHRIQVFDDSGKFLYKIESGFFAPRGICVDGKGRIWVADSGNGVLKLFSKDGKLVRVIGQKGSGKGEFMSPTGIAVDRKGKVYVADTGNRRVQILGRGGDYDSEFSVDGWQPGVYNEPGIDVDKRGDVYLTDPRAHRVLKYSRTGKLLGVLNPMEGGKPLLSFPMGVAVENAGDDVYIVDCRNHRIVKFTKGDFKL
ncbi:MAG: NHL repeat-containing protein, partial [bacterium]